MSTYIKVGLRWLLLSLALVISQFIASSLLSNPEPEVFANLEPNFLSFVLVSACEAAALLLLYSRLAVLKSPSMLRQFLLIFAIYWGTKSVQMQIEAWFFLNIWQTEPIMSSAFLLHSFWFGLLSSLLFCLSAIFILKTNSNEETQNNTSLPNAIPFLKTAALYVPIYLLAGALLAIPLAGSAFSSTYEDLYVPIWMPIFQFARGLLWALIIWWIVGFHSNKYDPRVTTAFCICLFSTIQLLHPNPFMLDQLRYAHLVEMSISMSLYGWLGASLYMRDLNRTK